MTNWDPTLWCPHVSSKPSSEDELRDHLARCAYCRDQLAWDDRLRDRLRRSKAPTPPELPVRVRSILRRRQVRRSVLAAAVLLGMGVLGWRAMPRNVESPIPPSTESRETTIDLPESQALFLAPPVDSLEVLTRQQAAYLDALGHSEELDR